MEDFLSSADTLLRATEVLNYGSGIAALILSAETMGVKLTPVEAVKLNFLYQAVNSFNKTTTVMIGIPIAMSSFTENTKETEPTVKH